MVRLKNKIMTTTTEEQNKQEQENDKENDFSAKITANQRLIELEKLGVETWNYQNYSCMLSVITLLNHGVPNWDKLPEPIKHDIEQKLYATSKTITQITNNLAADFKNIARQQIDTFLEIQETKEREAKLKQEEEKQARIKKLLERVKSNNNDNSSRRN